MQFELSTAVRYLLRSRSHKGFVAFFTIISVMGVFVGVAALIVVLSVMTGFERELKNKVIGVYAHVTVTGARRDALADWHIPAEIARKVPHVLSVAPYIAGPLLLGSWDRMRPLQIIATDTSLEQEASDLAKFVKVGSFKIADDQILMGEQIAERMGFRLGDKIQLTTAATVRTPDGRQVVPMQKAFEVAGFFKTGNYEYDANFGIVTLKTGQKLYSLGNRVHALKIRIDNVDDAPAVRAQIEDALGPDYDVRTWMDQNPAMFSAIQMEKKVMFLILSLIIAVAALNIISTLVMVVIEKTKDIGILRALGATRLSIGAIFTLQGFLIALISTVSGIVCGVLFAHNINAVSKFIEKYTGFNPFPSDVYYFDAIPSVIVPADVALIASCAMVLCVGASLFPSWLAARRDPVQALRYE